jgi:hypothetical protein
VSAKTSWLGALWIGVKIICSSGVNGLLLDCYWSQLSYLLTSSVKEERLFRKRVVRAKLNIYVLLSSWKNQFNFVGLAQTENHHHFIEKYFSLFIIYLTKWSLGIEQKSFNALAGLHWLCCKNEIHNIAVLMTGRKTCLVFWECHAPCV